jgi:divalent metal cation (Fe/Co/Zn/Cd) transporter
MWALIHYKVKIGRELNSPALLADANCSKICMWFSVILLISSAGYELTGIGLMDSFGAAGIAYLSFREGREAFWKVKGNLLCKCQDECH